MFFFWWEWRKGNRKREKGKRECVGVNTPSHQAKVLTFSKTTYLLHGQQRLRGGGNSKNEHRESAEFGTIKKHLHATVDQPELIFRSTLQIL